MTIANATKKLEKAGFKVENTGYGFHASKPATSKVIEFRKNGDSDEITCVKVRRVNDHSDAMSDYSAGSYFDTITRAIKFSV